MSSDVKAGGGEPRRWTLVGAERGVMPRTVDGPLGQPKFGERIRVVEASAFDAVVRERDEARAALEPVQEHAYVLQDQVCVLSEALAAASPWVGYEGDVPEVKTQVAAALASVADSDPEPTAVMGETPQEPWPLGTRPASSSGGVTREAESSVALDKGDTGTQALLADDEPVRGVTPEGRGDGHRLRFEWDGDSEWPTVSLVCPHGRAGCVPPVCEHGEQTGCEFGCQPSKEPCWIETWEGADVHDITGVVEVPVAVKSADNESAPEFTIVGTPVSSADSEGLGGCGRPSCWCQSTAPVSPVEAGGESVSINGQTVAAGVFASWLAGVLWRESSSLRTIAEHEEVASCVTRTLAWVGPEYEVTPSFRFPLDAKPASASGGEGK